MKDARLRVRSSNVSVLPAGDFAGGSHTGNTESRGVWWRCTVAARGAHKGRWSGPPHARQFSRHSYGRNERRSGCSRNRCSQSELRFEHRDLILQLRDSRP